MHLLKMHEVRQLVCEGIELIETWHLIYVT